MDFLFCSYPSFVIWLSALLRLNAVFGSVTNAPQNTVSLAGQNVTFHCTTSTRAVYWQFTNVNGVLQPPIYNGQMNPAYVRFSVSNSSSPLANEYNLTIARVNLTDAGTYTCQDNNGIGEARAAWLTVLDADPKCSCSSIMNDVTNLICTVSMYGRISDSNRLVPVGQWSKWSDASETTVLNGNSSGFYRNYTWKSYLNVSDNAKATSDFSLRFNAVVSDATIDGRPPTYNFTWRSPTTCATTSTTIATTSSTTTATTIATAKTTSTEMPLSVTDVRPLYGPASGGTTITISGTGLNNHLKAIGIGNISLPVVERSSNGLTAAPTPHSDSVGEQLRIWLHFDDRRSIDTRFNFTYKRTPTIRSIHPTEHLIVGGTHVTIVGTFMDSAAAPVIETTVVTTRSNGTTTSTRQLTCQVTAGSSQKITCLMPAVDLPNDVIDSLKLYDSNSSSLRSPYNRSRTLGVVSTYYGPNGVDRANIYFGLIFDGFSSYRNITEQLPDIHMTFYPAPTINNLSAVLEYSDRISIRGKHVTRGCQLDDYKVKIGDGQCAMIQLNDAELVCQPPAREPARSPNDSRCGQEHQRSITVRVGFQEYYCSCMKYPKPPNWLLLLLLLLLLLVIPVIIIIIIVVVIYIRSRRQNADIVASTPSLDAKTIIEPEKVRTRYDIKTTGDDEKGCAHVNAVYENPGNVHTKPCDNTTTGDDKKGCAHVNAVYENPGNVHTKPCDNTTTGDDEKGCAHVNAVYENPGNVHTTSYYNTTISHDEKGYALVNIDYENTRNVHTTPYYNTTISDDEKRCALENNDYEIAG